MKNERETRRDPARSSSASRRAIAMDRTISAECADPELPLRGSRPRSRSREKKENIRGEKKKKGRKGGGKWRALERNRERASAGEHGRTERYDGRRDDGGRRRGREREEGGEGAGDT